MLENISSNSKYTIKQILKDGNWDSFYNKNKGNIRDVVVENVNKVMACGEADIIGYHLYECPDCGRELRVANTCKSRFCNSCGKIMTDRWMSWAENNLLNVPYHHIVFSPPEELWLLFRG